MTGAGISTPSGIPDFRTPGTGLYDNMKQYDIPYPEAIFDIDYFVWNPKPFFCLAKSLYPGNYKPNDIHYFLRLLHDKGLLLRLYTQNIDGLERAAGIPSEKLIEAHGTFSTASCSLCNSPYPSEKAKAAILQDEIPRCETCLGIVKPDVAFFGESLPKDFYSYRKEFKQSDLLIVMGTSLEIEPFASIVNSVQPHIPRLLLNRNAVGPFKQIPLKRTDVRKLGDLIDSVRLLVKLVGWITDLDELIKVVTGLKFSQKGRYTLLQGILLMVHMAVTVQSITMFWGTEHSWCPDQHYLQQQQQKQINWSFVLVVGPRSAQNGCFVYLHNGSDYISGIKNWLRHALKYPENASF
ncbi:NAD-dependent protein deacetylase sirtuin-3 [Mustelus asterias]